VPPRDHLRRAAVERNRGDGVDRLRGAGGVVLEHAEQPVSAAVDAEVGIAQVARRGDRRGLRPRIEPVKPSALEVGEPHRPGVDDVRRAAVLVDAVAHVVWSADDVLSRAVASLPHQDLAAALLRPSLEPVEVIAAD